ncbi:MAG: STAS domain-containing protein [Acidaminococcaceae bacterium]|nr:STAS domain-containing protein [Acidaminococcaceae bacterium]
MKTELKDGEMIIALEGRIDSSNAQSVEQDIRFEMSFLPGVKTLFDADGLEYISSAGLRVLLKLCKEQKARLPVWNVSDEVFVIFDTTGFTEIS